MSEQHTRDDDDTTQESRMVKAIVRDTTIALPLALILVTAALMVFADNSLGDAIATAVLPGVLIGVFFGGFSGTARTMD
jgi:ABC-type Mn2+/Zn2+ transport system permease subunit